MKKICYNAVQLIFSGIITLLMIPAGGIFLVIRLVWKAMDGILEFIGSDGSGSKHEGN